MIELIKSDESGNEWICSKIKISDIIERRFKVKDLKIENNKIAEKQKRFNRFELLDIE